MECYKNQWEAPPADYRIERHYVHIWRCQFQSALVYNRDFTASLSTNEIEKACRYIRAKDRDRYIFAHGVLRSILGFYISCSPAELIFEVNPYGKPFLARKCDSSDIQFNMSHSENMTLLAVTRGARIGIDVEYMRSVPDARQIVDRYFSSDERRFLHSFSPVDFERGFFYCWSSKEAFLKGLGKGLTYPLDKFSITFSKGESEGFLQVYEEPVNADCWKITRLSPAPGYSGALAIEEKGSKPKLYQYCWQSRPCDLDAQKK